MDPAQAVTWAQFIREGGIIGVLCAVLFVILVGGYKQWWVWGYQYIDMREQRDDYRKRAEASTTLAEQGTTLAEKAVGLAAMK